MEMKTLIYATLLIALAIFVTHSDAGQAPVVSRGQKWEYGTLKYEKQLNRIIWSSKDQQIGSPKEVYARLGGKPLPDADTAGTVQVANALGSLGWEMVTTEKGDTLGDVMWFKRQAN